MSNAHASRTDQPGSTAREGLGEAARHQLLAIDTVTSAIQAQHLQTYLGGAQWVDPSEDANRAATRLAADNFDQAPAGAPGHLLGYVLTADLRDASGGSAARAALRPLDAEHLLSAGASVLLVLEALHARGPIAFVVDGRDVTGFVTSSDLNKHPARVHFYLLLTSFEISLAAWVRREYPDPHSTLGLLEHGGRKALHRFRRDQRNNVVVDLVAGMDLGDLLAIVGSRDDGRYEYATSLFESWEAWTAKLTSLRNAVMHPVLSFLGPSRTVSELISLERGLREVLERQGARV